MGFGDSLANWGLTSENIVPSAVLVGLQGVLGVLQDKWKEDTAEKLNQQQFENDQSLLTQRLDQEMKIQEMINALKAAELKQQGWLGAGQLGIGAANSSNSAIANFLRGIGQ